MGYLLLSLVSTRRAFWASRDPSLPLPAAEMRLAAMPFFTSQAFRVSARWREMRLFTATLPLVSHQPVTVTFISGFSFNIWRISFSLDSSSGLMAILLKSK